MRKKLGIRLGDPDRAGQRLRRYGAIRRNYLSKAFDNRMGCAVAVDVVKRFPARQTSEHDLCRRLGTGRSGACAVRRTLAHLTEPDVCFCVDVGVGQDIPPGLLQEIREAGRRPVDPDLRRLHVAQYQAARPDDQYRRTEEDPVST